MLSLRSTAGRVLVAALGTLLIGLSGAPAYACRDHHGKHRPPASEHRDADGHYRYSTAYAKRHPMLMEAVGIAMDQRGKRYKYGAEGPKRFDCSGLVAYSYGKAGIRVPRTSRDQYRAATRIKRADLRRGDLIFFHRGRRVYHVAVFLSWTKAGTPLFLHSPSPGKRVQRDVPWTRAWWAATIRKRA